MGGRHAAAAGSSTAEVRATLKISHTRMRPLRGCFRNFSRWRSSGPGGLLASYDAAVARGRIRPDPAQRAAAEALQRLQDGTLADSGGSEAAAGAYIHGPVGGGKSMLMDLFYETRPDTL